MPSTLLLRILVALVVVLPLRGASAGAPGASVPTPPEPPVRWLLLATGAGAEALVPQVAPLLAARGGVSVVTASDLSRALPPPLEPAPAATADAMRAALQGAARRLYYQRDRPAAERVLGASLRAAEDLLTRLRDPVPLWHALRAARLVLATAALQRGARDVAASHCRAVIDAEPAFEPSARDVPPSLRALYAEERSRFLAGVRPLRVDGAPAVTVVVDGVPRGAAPLEVQVREGAHVVQGREGALLGAPTRVEVAGAGARVRVEPWCGAPEHRASARCAEAVRWAAGARAVVVLAQRGPRIALARHGEAALPPATVELPVRATAPWLAELADYLLGKRARPPAPVPLAVARPRFYERWWFWSLVAGVAAGASAAAIFAPRGGAGLDLVYQRGARP